MYQSKFLKPADSTYLEDKSDIDITSGTSFVYNPNYKQSIEKQRQRLPVFALRNHILYLVEKFQTTIVVGETGSGKSTQIPQYLIEVGWGADGIIGVTEPRRVACTSLASRVAEEKGCELGQGVGFAIRFDDCTTHGVTKIKYLTEGLLVREMMADPLLRQYCVIMVDEVHERTLYTDILLGLLKKILKKRKDLKLIISSATVDAEQMYNFFNFNKTVDKTNDTAVPISVQGRQYPVDIYYLDEPLPDYVKGTVETVVKIHKCKKPGNILAFLTGVEEVDTCVSLLKEHSDNLEEEYGPLLVLPMHGSLSNNSQLRVFLTPPRGTRKVVIATNIAETSITIPEIIYVIDSGFVKLRWYNAETYSDSLVVVPTSKASAMQRTGRAGRMRSGIVYRLYPETEYSKLVETTPPEMVRTNLSRAVLNLMSLGIVNMLRFDFPMAPPASHLVAALDELFALGAINMEGQLSEPLGHQMAEFPLSPLFSKMLLVSGDFGCSEEILSIIAMLQVQNIFIKLPGQSVHAATKHRQFQVEEGDLITLLNVYSSFIKSGETKHWCNQNCVNFKALKRAKEIRIGMVKLLNNFNIPLNTSEGAIDPILKCITAGLFPNAAYLHYSGYYRTVRSEQPLLIHPSSGLYTEKQPQWVLFCEVLHTTKVYMRDLTVIDPAWLLELAPHFYEKSHMFE